MMLNQSKQLHIKCGLVNDPNQNKVEGKLFWPIVQAVPLEIKIDFSIFETYFSIVFTSKTAVRFFYNKIYQNHKDLFLKCKKIFCVGEKTKEYFENLFKHIDAPDILISKKMGIKNLIEEYELSQKTETLIFFTALIGKTRDVVKKIDFMGAYKIIPLYKLELYKSDFLRILLNNGIKTDVIYFFECYSGQVLQSVVLTLLEFFNCNNVFLLPKNIRFLSIGTSTKEVEKRFYEKQ